MHRNPTREGCEPHDALIALSRRKRPIDDPAWEHLFECSPCYAEVRGMHAASASDRVRPVMRHGGTPGWPPLLRRRSWLSRPASGGSRRAWDPAIAPSSSAPGARLVHSGLRNSTQ